MGMKATQITYYIGQSLVTGQPLFWAWKNHPIMSMLSGHGDRNKRKKRKIELVTSYLKLYSFVKQLLAIPTSLLLEVNILNPFSCTFVQYTIVVKTDHNFTSYFMEFNQINFCLGISTLSYIFRCRIFTLWLKLHIRVLKYFNIVLLGTQGTWYFYSGI